MTAVRVKICGLTRAEDVEAAVDAGADALGFVFTPRSRRVLNVAEARPLLQRVPAFVARVGLFMDQERDEVAAVLDDLPLNVLQFHGGEDAAFCESFGLPWIKAVSVRASADVEHAAVAFRGAAALLLDSHAPGGAGGTGEVFDWSLVSRATLPLVLAGGLTPDNVRQAIARVRPWAVDVSSGVEDAPGIKNPRKIRRFMEEAKSEY